MRLQVQVDSMVIKKNDTIKGGEQELVLYCEEGMMKKEEKEKWRRLRLTEGHTQQQQGRDQQDGAGGQGPRGTVVVVAPVAVAPVGPVAVVAETAFHPGPGAAAMSLLAESLVRARLHHGV